MTRPLPLALALLFLAPMAAARADSAIVQHSCERLRPSDPPCPTPAIAAQAQVQAQGDLSERTHAMMLPTGNLLRQGQTSVQIGELGIYDRLAYGASDRIELNAGVLLPIAFSVGAKVALIEPTGAFRLTAGASYWKGMGEQYSPRLLTAGLTAAYQGDAINVHASVETATRLDSDVDAIGGYSLGVLARVSPKLAFSGELLRFGLEQMGLADQNSGSDCCGEAVVFGAKLMGESWDFDVGVLSPMDVEGGFVLPVFAASTRL